MRPTILLTVAICALTACSGGSPAPETTSAAGPDASSSSPAADETGEAAPASAAPSAETASASSAPEAAPSPTASTAAGSARPLPGASASAAPVALAPPPPSFARCSVCHNAEKGAKDKIGPNLYGVYGAKAGLGGFAFSDAMKSSGLTWNDETLDKWIAGPAALVPGTRMSFPGIKDPAKRAEIIAFLKSRR